MTIVIGAIALLRMIPLWLFSLSVAILVLLVSLRHLNGRVVTVIIVLSRPINGFLLLCTLAYGLWTGMAARRAEDSRRAAAEVTRAASLMQLEEYLSVHQRQLPARASRQLLRGVLANTSLSCAQRGNAAICLLQISEDDALEEVLDQAFAHNGDPSLRWWVLGAAPMWVNQHTLPTLLRLADSTVQLPLSTEAQIRDGAIAALGVAGPDRFMDKKTRSDIAERLLAIQKATLGHAAGLDTLVHWVLWRFGWDSHMQSVGTGKPPAFGWYRNPAGLTVIRLDDAKLETPGATRPLEEYYLSSTEVTVAAFQAFVEATAYRTTAEQNGVSWGLDFNYQWNQLEGANWRDAGLPGPVAYTTPALPVVHVSWVDAVHFCNWLSTLEGLEPYYQIEGSQITPRRKTDGYRIPTRAEWTCAALADTRTSFWWGRYEYLHEPNWRTDRDWAGMVANLPDRSLAQRMDIVDAMAADDGFVFAAPVASFCPNPLGFFDLSGNVAEWCDWDDWDLEDRRLSARKPRMGGSWGDELRFCTWRAERDEEMTSSHVNVGFRVARSAD
ncbi:MAG: SUMF1/EgtB/PvdO family nonheme iron enzyme [Phycisphaerae bacterium]